jgi:hypothetical protein
MTYQRRGSFLVASEKILAFELYYKKWLIDYERRIVMQVAFFSLAAPLGRNTCD